MTNIIAEIGINHHGSFEFAKALILQAKKSGAWGVKFQYRNLQNYFKNKKKYNFDIGKEIIDKEIKRNYLSPSKIIKLSNFAKKNHLKVGCSFFDYKDLSDFNNYYFDFFKVPSAANQDEDLIKAINKYKTESIMISLGSIDHKSILDLKKKIKKISNKKIILFHCVSNYPLNPINSKLGYIDNLKKIFKEKKFSIGYSSHEQDIINCIISLQKKVSFIERHITLNTDDKGLDHSSSSNFSEFSKLCFYAKNYNLLTGYQKSRELNQGEKINLQNLGKSAYAKNTINVNSKLKFSDIEFKSPLIGIDSSKIKKLLNKKVFTTIHKGDLIQEQFFQKSKKLKKNVIKFCRSKKISLPIRPYDFKKINQQFNLYNYEFHLSINDLNKINNLNIDFNNKNLNFSVHAPDYISEHKVLDIFSNDRIVKKKSLEVLKKCINFCKNLQIKTKKKCYLICSFSSTKTIDKIVFYKKLNNVIRTMTKKTNIVILPQWLPPYAWYFGGSIKMFAFSKLSDLDYLKKINMKICLDLSHFIMCCNYENKNYLSYIKKFKKIIYHYHIADAKGIDGEGYKFDLTSGKKVDLIKYIIKQKPVKVIETWQGHLNNAKIFKEEILKIKKLYEKK